VLRREALMHMEEVQTRGRDAHGTLQALQVHRFCRDDTLHLLHMQAGRLSSRRRVNFGPATTQVKKQDI
jgi:hypothetical protein